MAENSSIEWTDHTFNPWIGCTHVSPGCEHCYAETMMDQRWSKVEWGKGKPRQRTSAANWRLPIKWNKQAAAEGVRRRVFCASLADVFDDEVEWGWREDLWGLIHDTPQLDWLLLTKRPQNIAAMVPAAFLTMPRHNIWLGITVEDQRRANERIPELLKITATVRFLSCEPLLGPVDLWRWLVADMRADGGGVARLNQLHWIICGGESGHGARPMHPQWARSLRDQCQAAGVAFFFKQYGEYATHTLMPASRVLVGEGEQEMIMYRVGKKAAGRLLDKREWNEVPE